MYKLIVGLVVVLTLITLIGSNDSITVIHAQTTHAVQRKVQRTVKKVVTNKHNQHTAMRVLKAIGHSVMQLLVKILPWLLKIAQAILTGLVKLAEQIYRIVTTQHHVATH